MPDPSPNFFSLSETLDRLIVRLDGRDDPSFRALATVAGLDMARDFVGASLRELDFRNQDLRGFNFANADLSGADFRGAQVDGVSFENANLIGAIGLTDEASFDSDAVDPNAVTVFLSYSEDDRYTYETPLKKLSESLPALLSAALPSSKIRVVRSLPATGEEWSEKEKARIKGAKVFVALLSRRWFDSRYCTSAFMLFEQAESGEHAASGVVPVILDQLRTDEVPLSRASNEIYQRMRRRDQFLAVGPGYTSSKFVELVANQVIAIVKGGQTTLGSAKTLRSADMRNTAAAVTSHQDPVYVIFDVSDSNYYVRMKGWKKSRKIGFDFRDARSLDDSGAASSTGSYVAGLARKAMAGAAAAIICVSDRTRNASPSLLFEIELALELQLPLIVANLNGERVPDPTTTPYILRDADALHIPFDPAVIKAALDEWPNSFRKLPADRKPIRYFYSADFYRKLHV